MLQLHTLDKEMLQNHQMKMEEQEVELEESRSSHKDIQGNFDVELAAEKAKARLIERDYKKKLQVSS